MVKKILALVICAVLVAAALSGFPFSERDSTGLNTSESDSVEAVGTPVPSNSPEPAEKSPVPTPSPAEPPLSAEGPEAVIPEETAALQPETPVPALSPQPETQEGEDSQARENGEFSIPEDNLVQLLDAVAEAFESAEGESILSSPRDIGLWDADGSGTNYVFTYGGTQFHAQYATDNWKIIDSYRITNAGDMKLICQALLDTHPIHGRDMQSYRTAEDMVYEWEQHNLMYTLLPEDSSWRGHAKDVDFDPKDQGKSYEEMYEDRTGKPFQLEDFLG